MKVDSYPLLRVESCKWVGLLEDPNAATRYIASAARISRLNRDEAIHGEPVVCLGDSPEEARVRARTGSVLGPMPGNTNIASSVEVTLQLVMDEAEEAECQVVDGEITCRRRWWNVFLRWDEH